MIQNLDYHQYKVRLASAQEYTGRPMYWLSAH